MRPAWSAATPVIAVRGVAAILGAGAGGGGGATAATLGAGDVCAAAGTSTPTTPGESTGAPSPTRAVRPRAWAPGAKAGGNTTNWPMASVSASATILP